MHPVLPRATALIAAGWLVPALLLAQTPTGATAKCKDGTYSTSTVSKGRCSNHGGVARLITAKKPTSRPSTTTTRRAATTTSHAPRTSPAKTSSSRSTAAPAKSPTPQPATVRAPAGAPAGATALCKDGTYSTSKVHTGACSHHGGVNEWLQ
jgi:uncharacterized protein DUF3761